MSCFQTQSQWENESEQNALSNNDSADRHRKHGITVNKKALIIISTFLVISIVAAFVYYNSAKSIEGIWIRQMDDNTTVAGMTVEVSNNNGRLEGKIIAMPAGAAEFHVGQIKWFGIKKIGLGKYVFYDLISKEGGEKYTYSSNGDEMIVSSSGDQLTITANHDVDRGAFQMWIKQKND